jgi:hypothetical protein
MPAPRGRRTMRRTGPAGCDSCGARIVFVKMVETGRRVPVDPFPVDDGNVCARAIGNNLHGYVVSAEHPAQAGYTRFAAHFGTCPDRPKAPAKSKPEAPPTLFDLPKE